MMSMEQDHYGVLELEPCSPMEDVKSQYRRLAKLCHPDLHGDDARCAEQFRRVNAAYTFLSDSPRKAAYDAVLQAARRAGAPPLRPTMPPKSPTPSAANSHQASVTAGGFQEEPRDSIRMTRSAWLGATAGAVVVLLAIGLSLSGSGPRRPASFGVTSPAPAASAPGDPLDTGHRDGSEPGAAPDPADPTPADPAPAEPPVTPTADAAPAPRPRVPPGIGPLKAPVRPDIVGGVWRTSRADTAGTVPSDADPAGALRRRLLARYHAALPRADRLLDRGSAMRAAGPEDGSGRGLREQLASDLAGLSAARARLRPALARLSRRDTPEEMHQEAGAIVAGLARLEAAGKPVRNDIKALAAGPTDPRPPRVAFQFSPLVPLRSEVSPAAPSPDPAPAVIAAVPPPPRRPDKAAPDPAVKPKAQADTGQEFIPWGKPTPGNK